MTRILAIGAHPDDCEVGAAGMLQAHRERRIVVLSMGERGGHPVSRRAEAEAAAKVLGASLSLHALADTSMTVGDIIPVLEHEIADYQPDVICTMSTHDTHQDHSAVGRASLIACRDTACTLLAYVTPSAAERFRPNWFQSLDEAALQTKMEALRCHASQRDRVYMTGPYLQSMARYWAMVTRSKAPYVEPFELVRKVDSWA